MVGINLFGFRKFELLRGEGEGGGGGEGPGDGGGDGLDAFGGAGADVSSSSSAGASASADSGGVGPGAADASFGGLQGTDAATGGGGGFNFEAAEADSGGFNAVDVGLGFADMASAGDLSGTDELGGLGEVDVENQANFDSGMGLSPGEVNAQVGTGYGGLLGGLSQDQVDTFSPGFGDSFGAAQVAEDALASEALALDQGITGMLGGDSVSPVDFTATDAATTGLDINPAALAAATGIVGAGISDPAEIGIQDPSGITNISPVEITVDPTNTSGGTTTSIVGTSMFDNMRDLMAQEEATNNPAVADLDAGMGAAIAANDGFNVTVGNPVTGASANVADLGFDAVGTGTGVNTVETPSFVSGMDAVDATISPISETDAFLGNLTMGTGVTDIDTVNDDPVAFAENYVSPLADEFGVIDYSSVPDTEAKNKDPNAAVTADTLYGTSKVTGEQVTAMDPGKAAAMTGGVPGTMTGMNLAQDQNSLEAGKQAAAMDVLGAQIGAGNLTGNEDIDQVNIELAKKGVQIDTSGLPGLLGTGVNAINKNYQLNQNQDILTQLAQGTGNDDATNTGILGTGIGAVTGVNTYTPAYNAQGQIVGSVATDAAGNAVGGGAGITTNVVGGLGAMDDVYSDAAGTELYTGVNEAVGDFQDMVAASKSSDEGPPQDVTSVDSNGCVIGAEFFDGQKCSPIGSTTGDATGGGTGGAYTPYSYQPGQGTMLRPDFSDAFTSNVQFNTLNPNASNMNFLKPAVNPYGNFAGGGIVPMMRNNRYR